MKNNRFKDRADAWLVTDLDPLHQIMNYIIGSRTENEAVCNIELDITNLSSFLKKKNEGLNPDEKYTIFHFIMAALARTVKERKQMNYFVRGGKFWERKIISFAYVAKKQIKDGSEENIIIQEYHPESDASPLKQMHDRTIFEVNRLRNNNENNSEASDLYNKILKLPRFILSPLMAVIRLLDKHGRIPYKLMKEVPYSATCFISNLGSIKMNATYHHLVNFGSNSIFLIIGEKKFSPRFNADGTSEIKEYLPMAFTLDERISDGVYFAKSIKIFQALLLNPELLDLPANEAIDFEKLLKETF